MEKIYQFFIFGILLFFSSFLYAQEIQWASEVGYVSSAFVNESNTKAFQAEQILGEPSLLANQNKSSPCAWAPIEKEDDELDSILVKYAKSMRINRVLICENFNAGAITDVYVYNTQNKIFKIYEGKPQRINPRLWNLCLTEPIDSIVAVKIIINTYQIEDWNQIDAVGISFSDKPITISVDALVGENYESKVENLGKNINTEHQELVPIISPDGRTLYFTRSQHYENIGEYNKQDIWYAEILSDGNFGQAKNIGKPLNNSNHNSAFTILNNGNSILLNNMYKRGHIMRKGVSISTRNNKGKWRFPQNIDIKGYNNQGKFSEFWITPDRKNLLISFQNDESFGGNDIYVSFLQKDSSYSKPTNLGKSINTIASETSPFLYKDGKTLFFSTSGYLGFGSNDIFVSYRLDDTWTNWSAPKNLGSWINTSEWDAYLTIPESGDYLYFASYKNAIGDSDIFRVKLTEELKKILFRE